MDNRFLVLSMREATLESFGVRDIVPSNYLIKEEQIMEKTFLDIYKIPLKIYSKKKLLNTIKNLLRTVKIFIK